MPPARESRIQRRSKSAARYFRRAASTRNLTMFGPDLAPLAGFRQPVEGLGARQVQFSLDFEF